MKVHLCLERKTSSLIGYGNLTKDDVHNPLVMRFYANG